MIMKTYLVTGAAGFIGSHTVEYLLKDENNRVVGVDNLRTGNLDNLKRVRDYTNFSFLEMDLKFVYNLKKLFKNQYFDGILHTAAMVNVLESIQKPEECFSINVAMTDQLAHWAVEHGCPRFVFSSSAAVYGDTRFLPLSEKSETRPKSPYAASKLASEFLLSCYDIEAVSLRYFNVYGLRQSLLSSYSGVLTLFADRVKKGQKVQVFGDGDQVRDFVSVKDVARANSLALTAPSPCSGVYNICTSIGVTLNQVLKIMSELGVYVYSIEAEYLPERQGDIRHSIGISYRAGKNLGFYPSENFQEGIKELLLESQ
jgi:UDP-glucose 4-epimerase